MIFFYIPGHGSRSVTLPVGSEYKIYSSVRIYLFLTQRLPLLQEEALSRCCCHFIGSRMIPLFPRLCFVLLSSEALEKGWVGGMEGNGLEVGFGW